VTVTDGVPGEKDGKAEGTEKDGTPEGNVNGGNAEGKASDIFDEARGLWAHVGGADDEGGEGGGAQGCIYSKPTVFFFFTLVIAPRRSLSLKLSDTRVYEPQIRARLGTTVWI